MCLFGWMLSRNWINKPLWPLAQYRHANKLSHLFSAAGIRVCFVALLRKYSRGPHQSCCMTNLLTAHISIHTHTSHTTVQFIYTDCNHQMHSQSVPNNPSCSQSTWHGCCTATHAKAEIYSTQKWGRRGNLVLTTKPKCRRLWILWI